MKSISNQFLSVKKSINLFQTELESHLLKNYVHPVFRRMPLFATMNCMELLSVCKVQMACSNLTPIGMLKMPKYQHCLFSTLICSNKPWKGSRQLILFAPKAEKWISTIFSKVLYSSVLTLKRFLKFRWLKSKLN